MVEKFLYHQHFERDLDQPLLGFGAGLLDQSQAIHDAKKALFAGDEPSLGKALIELSKNDFDGGEVADLLGLIGCVLFGDGAVCGRILKFEISGEYQHYSQTPAHKYAKHLQFLERGKLLEKNGMDQRDQKVAIGKTIDFLNETGQNITERTLRSDWKLFKTYRDSIEREWKKQVRKKLLMFSKISLHKGNEALSNSKYEEAKFHIDEAMKAMSWAHSEDYSTLKKAFEFLFE